MEQIEFYLSYANLYNDAYLRKLIAKNKEQRVDFETLLDFNKIKYGFRVNILDS